MEILNSATKIVLLLVIIAVIFLNVFQIEVAEPLNNIAISIIAFYFWQKVNTNNDLGVAKKD